MTTPGYEYEFDPDAENNTAAFVHRLALSGGPRVLDLGSGPGIVAAHLQTVDERIVTCVDADPKLLEGAQRRGVAETIQGDLDGPDWAAVLEGRRFDVIILADVLEHLIDPGAVLDTIRRHELLVPDGFLVVSIPNAAHDAVVGELMTGHFTYQPTGLLDRTHVRFFTKDSFTELAERHGFDVGEVHRTLRTLEQTEFKARAHDLDAGVRDVLADRGLDGRTYQYVMRLVPMTATARAAELGRRVDRLQEELLDVRSAASVAAAEADKARAEGDKALTEAAKQSRSDAAARVAEEERQAKLAAKVADLQKSNRRLRRNLGEQRAQQLRRLEEFDTTIAGKERQLARLGAELETAAGERRRLTREIDKIHHSFTWKAGRVVKGAIYPAVLVKNLVRRRRQPEPEAEPTESVGRQTLADEPKLPADSPPSDPPFVLAESPLRSRYEAEARQSEFAGTGGRSIAFATYTLDFDEGRGDVYVAVGIGRQLRAKGADVVYRAEGLWYEYRDPPDVVVAMLPGFQPSQLDPEIRTVAWIRNQVDSWLVHGELQLFDGILCSSERSRRAIAEVYAGPNAVLPIGVDTELFAAPDGDERNGVVSTVNQWGREREVNRALRSASVTFPLAIYGQTRGLAETLQPYVRHPVSYFALPGLYLQASIVLDDFNHTTVAWGNVNSRIYESLAAGALPVTNTSRGLSDLGLDELPTFGSPAELNPLVQRLIDDPQGTADLAKRLGEVVRTQHGFDRRADSLSAFLNEIDTGTVEDRAVVGFFPDYRASNPYQTMLYGSLIGVPAVAVPIDLDAVDSTRAPYCRSDGPHLFHLHWTAPILGPASTEREAIGIVHALIKKLDRFIAEGGLFIWTVHNLLPHECRFPSTEVMLRQELADRAHVIHVMCPQTQAAVEEHYHLPQERVRVVRHSSFIGVYPDGYDPDRARSELGIEPDDIALLALGGIRPYKGIDRLLDAFDEALSREPRLRLIVAGKPGRFPGVGELESRCRSHPRVIANFNTIPDDELQVFFKASDVVVLPHRTVLNSGALLLAYSFARPVIASGTGCLAELLDPSASIRFDGGDATALTEALAKAETLANHQARLAARRIAESRLPADMASQFARLVSASGAASG